MAKKQDKSSKTAHVLNLLTSPAEKQAAAQRAAAANAEEPAEAAAAAPGPSSDAVEAAEINQQAAQVHQPLIPPILQVAHHHDETLAEQIRGALEQELGAEAPPATTPAAVQPAVESEPVVAPEPAAPEPEQIVEPEPEVKLAEEPAMPAVAPEPVVAPEPTAPEPEPVLAPEPETAMPAVEPEPAVLPQPAVPEPEPVVEPEPVPAPQPIIPPQPEPHFNLSSSAIMSSFTIPEPPPLPPMQEELTFVNIMQMLVENMAPRYVEKLGLCSCTRCLEDVKALALTNLRPRYTVFPVSERVPMMTLYERRYSSLVATELTKACYIVKANPRHR